MSQLAPIFWVVGVLMMYATIWLLIVEVLEGCRYRSIGLVLGAIISLSPAVAVYKLVHLPSATKFAAIMAVALIGVCILYAIGPRRVKDWKRVKHRKEYARKTIYHLVLLTGSAIFITPFVWLVTTSFKEEDEIFKYPPVWIPTRPVTIMYNGKQCGLYILNINGRREKVVEISESEEGMKTVRVLDDQPDAGKTLTVPRSQLTMVRKVALKWENYTDALNYLPEETHKGLLYLWNTVYITLLSILGTLLSCSMVAYSFARLRWPGRDQLFLVLLSTMMIPGAVTMIPVFLIMRSLGWYDTLRPLWVPAFFGGAFGVFLLRQFFMTIPTDLEDAAKIDGCSYFGIYWKIMLPLIKPALAALTIMTFMGSWNNFMGPLIYINSPEKMPLAYALQLFQGAHGAEYGLLMAASTLVMLPVLIVFFFTQRYFIQGITLTGIKG
jgi:multiple sugar transport system permease protein